MASLEITRRTQRTQLSHGLRNESSLSPEEMRKIDLMGHLASCCLDRGEAMDEIRLESYSTALMEAFLDDADTVIVLRRLSNSIREEFEPIIPPKAELIVMVKREDWTRKRKAREEREAAEEKAYAQIVKEEREAGGWEPLPMTPDNELDVMALQREVNPKRTTAVPVKHEVTTVPLEHGWYRQACTCGRKWDTAGTVPTCGAANWKQHKAECEAGLAGAQSRRTKEPA